jgi:hypothetical protein
MITDTSNHTAVVRGVVKASAGENAANMATIVVAANFILLN